MWEDFILFIFFLDTRCKQNWHLGYVKPISNPSLILVANQPFLSFKLATTLKYCENHLSYIFLRKYYDYINMKLILDADTKKSRNRNFEKWKNFEREDFGGAGGMKIYKLFLLGLTMAWQYGLPCLPWQYWFTFTCLLITLLSCLPWQYG